MSIDPFQTFLPTFFGVTLAFFLDRFVDLYKEKSDRKRLIRSIHMELGTNHKRLDGHGKLVDKDIWDSGVASGKIQLLCPEQLGLLSKLYHSMENYNYEAKICRQAGEEYRSIPRSEGKRKGAAYQRWNGLSAQLGIIESNLNQHINKVLQEKFWR